MFLGCQNQPWLLDANLDLDQNVTSSVTVVGSGQDYDGTNLTYALQGTYLDTTQELSASITWTFEGLTQQRVDEFVAELSTGDSGVVFMNQVQVTGCDAQIQIIDSDLAISPIMATISPSNDLETLGWGAL